MADMAWAVLGGRSEQGVPQRIQTPWPRWQKLAVEGRANGVCRDEIQQDKVK